MPADPAPLTPSTEGDTMQGIRRRHGDWAVAAGTFGALISHPDDECWGDIDRHYLLATLDAARAVPPQPSPALDARIERLRARLIRHHRDEHVTQFTCPSCRAAQEPSE